MRIALGQMDVKPGQPKKNLEKILSMIESAKQQNVDLVVFPEMCVGGYFVGDKWNEDAFNSDLMRMGNKIKDASHDIAIAFGNVYRDHPAYIEKRTGSNTYHPNKDGRKRKYNAMHVFQNGKPVRRKKETNLLPAGVQPKTLLPTYRIFDDQRYFFSTEDVAKDFNVELEELLQPFMINVKGKEVPIGFEICEDLWCEDYRKDNQPINPTKILIENGAELIINGSASPWTYGKNAARDKRVRFLKQESGNKFTPFLYVNNVGAQNNGKNIITFDGGSTAYNKNGEPVQFAEEAYKEELMIIDTETLEQPGKVRVEKPEIGQKLDAIITGIRHMPVLIGREDQPKYVIGMSGGVDSSVVAAILTLAVGSNKIMGINMPSKYNSEGTKNAAAHTAKMLDIGYATIPINKIITAVEETIQEHDLDGSEKQLTPVQEGNIHAKIRGTDILSNIAAKYGALFTNNGNKLETSIGYATLYGDVNGAIAPLGDLLKTEVFEMARYLNIEVFRKEVIPEVILPDDLYRFPGIPPTAELEKNQIDPMKFGYHDALLKAFLNYKRTTSENVLSWYLSGQMEKNLGVSYALLERWGLTHAQTFTDDLEWFSKGIAQSTFKRVQAPPIIILSKSSFGYDHRESILPWQPTERYQRLKQEVLEMKTYGGAS